MPSTDSQQSRSTEPAAIAAALDSEFAAPIGAAKGYILLLAIPVLIAIIAWCYAPAVVNGFLGDDFLHVRWLGSADKNPGMLWDNFTGPWLGTTAVKFYRPLISVILWLDHRIWGFNAVGFHLTNIAFHAAGAICLLFTGQRLALLSGFQKNAAQTVGLFAAALWGIYPLNAEVVAWITGRVDATVTAFSLGCFLAYLKWRESKSPLMLALSLVLFVLALWCKEMAVIVPPLFACVDILFPTGGKRSRLHSLPFWLVLGGYLVLRQITMGTMIGAYDDSLSADIKTLWKRFKSGIPFLFVPFNLNIFLRTDLIVKAWCWLLAAIAVGGAVQLIATRCRMWRFYALGAIWFALALLPVYKMFSVGQDLNNSRYAYSAVLPLCLLFAGMATPVLRSRLIAGMQYAVFVALAGIAMFVLHTHCEVWGGAAHISNRIIRQMHSFVQEAPPNPMLVIVGAPDNVNGAYLMRNALDGMVSQPFFARPVSTTRTVDRYCAIYPFALFRDSWTGAANAIMACWNDEAKELEKSDVFPSSWFNKKHDLPLKNVQVGGGSGRLDTNGLSIRAPQKYTILDLRDLNEKCADIDFVQVTLKGCRDDVLSSTMTYVNHLHPNAWPTYSSTVHASVIQLAPHLVRVSFPLRQHPEWVLGGRCTELVFGIPADNYTIQSIEVRTAAGVIPRIVLPPSALDGNSLFLLPQASEIVVPERNKRAALLELSARGQYFEKHYATTASPQSSLKYFAPDQPVLIDRRLLVPGTYQARLWFADAQRKPQGLSSDHFTVTVFPQGGN
jgi:hypothetical protein